MCPVNHILRFRDSGHRTFLNLLSTYFVPQGYSLSQSGWSATNNLTILHLIANRLFAIYPVDKDRIYYGLKARIVFYRQLHPKKLKNLRRECGDRKKAIYPKRTLTLSIAQLGSNYDQTNLWCDRSSRDGRKPCP